MRVFVAGATGTIGSELVVRLVAAGHEVHGMTRSRVQTGDAPRIGGGTRGRRRA